MEKKIDKKTKTMERDRCKTCNCQYRLEIEHLRLVKHWTYKQIADHLMQQYGFSITVKGLSNHFNQCLQHKQQVAEAESASNELIASIRERKKDLLDILFESLADLFSDKVALEAAIKKNGIEKTPRTIVDLLRVLSGETREHINLINKLMQDGKSAGNVADAAAILAAFEAKRKDFEEILKDVKQNGFEVTDEGGDTDENDDTAE